MSGLSSFFATNVERRENKKFAVSKRFKDAKGNPIEWEIRSISADEDEAIRKECTKNVPIPGKRNQYRQVFDSNAYLTKLAVKSVVFPDLNDAELQNSYKVMGAEELIKTMLYKDEFDALTEQLVADSEAEDINDLVEEAKN
jgi:hypothetical protein